MILPSVQDIHELHRKHAPTPEAFELVFTHCEIVWHIAEQLLAGTEQRIDAELVRAGALLHDIGVYRLYGRTGRLDTSRYIQHGVLGHDILRDEGFPERLCRFCSCHTGVGLTRHDIRRQDLALPPADYLAETPEERLVMYADKFHSKTSPPRFNSVASYSAHVARFGPDKVRAFRDLRAQFGEPDLASLGARYGHRS
ncbi:HD domain-containing protein [Streptomyces sp. NPDC002537]